jgi:hypothetical protein
MQKRDQIKTADAKWKSASPCPRVIRPLLAGSRKDAKDSVSAFAVLPLVGPFLLPAIRGVVGKKALYSVVNGGGQVDR